MLLGILVQSADHQSTWYTLTREPINGGLVGMDASQEFSHGGQFLEIMMAFSKVFQVCQALLRGLIVQKSYKNRWIP
jgi:hypothetical protein